MKNENVNSGTIMRLFHVKAKNGCVENLLKKFDTTSADVVKNEPGNRGYFFGSGVSVNDNVVIFASFWSNIEAVKKRFGEDWQKSFLPYGYENLIEECCVEHIEVGSNWYVELK